ncbi:MAG: hypothetical protein U0704_04510 [Candidatus Eisenbacteria bacterium]
MTTRTRALFAGLALLAAAGAMVWKAELFTVQRAGTAPRALALLEDAHAGRRHSTRRCPWCPSGCAASPPRAAC